MESHEVGIVVDFEEMPKKSQPDFRAFIGEFGAGVACRRIEIDDCAARAR